MSILQLDHIDFEIISKIIRTTRILDKAISEELSSFNITKSQLDVLVVIHFSYSEKLKASQIAKELFVSKANISGILKHLVKKKYIKISSDPSDSRASNISLTKSADQLLNNVLPQFFSVGNNALIKFSLDEKTKLLSHLCHIEEQVNIGSQQIQGLE